MGLLDTLADLRNHEFLQDGFGTTSNLELTDEEGRKHKHRIHGKINATNAEFLVDMVVKGQGITFIQGRYLITRITSHIYHSRIIAYSLTNPTILVTYAPYSVIAEMTPISFLVLYLASASAILFCATTVNTQGLPI